MVKCVTWQRNPKGLDSASERLVWVQRKNSTWWPGQIMDVTKNRLYEAKSNAVPIKLLGRDDVDVEWYNLEVAKDVKAFRCGDLDSCIGKAKALQANSSKRKHKLSKRDNAIILALELEASRMSKYRVGNFCEANDLVNRKRTQNHPEHDDREGIKKRTRVLDGPNSSENKSVPQNLSSLDDLFPVMDGRRGDYKTYFRKKRSKAVFEEIRKEDTIVESDSVVSVPIIYDELPSPRKLSDSDDVSGENLCYNANTVRKFLGYDSSDNPFDVPLIKKEELSDDLRVNEAEETEISLLGWQSKRRRNPRQKIRNPKRQFDRYKFLESCIKPHTSPEVYYDVEIEVDESHCSKNAQNISLRSILNRKPISGQPISVEVLGDCSCDFLLDTLMVEDCERTGTRTPSLKTRPFACIPIKVVFSRIYEALDRSVSKG